MASVASAQATKAQITLRGSTAIVTEFFGYGINNILYQRGIYPPENFEAVQKYGLRLMQANDPGLVSYLEQVLSQLSDWLTAGKVQCLVLVISDLNSGQALERWCFNIEAEHDEDGRERTMSDKPDKDVTREIQAIMRQITSSVSFLPLLDGPFHTDVDTAVPRAWEESDPKYIANAADVKLRSFTTKIHRVDALVSYKVDDDEQ